MDYRVRILLCTLLFVWNAVAEGDDMAGVLTEDSDGPAPPIMDINQKPPGSVKVVTPPMTNQNGASDAAETPKLLGSVKGLPKHSMTTGKSSEVGSEPVPVALALTQSKSAVTDQKVALSGPGIMPAEANTPLVLNLNTSVPGKEESVIVKNAHIGSANVTGQTSTSTLGTKPAENEVEEVKEEETKKKEEGTEKEKGTEKNEGEDKKEKGENKEKEDKKEGEEDLAGEKEKEGDAVDPAVQEAKNMEVAEKEFEEDNDGADDDDTKNDKKEKVEVVKEEKKEATKRPYPFIPDQFIREESTDSHFMMWMMLFGTIVLISYVVVHNKKKVLGLMFEGRTGGGGRRGRGNVRYRPLSQTEHENVIY